MVSLPNVSQTDTVPGPLKRSNSGNRIALLFPNPPAGAAAAAARVGSGLEYELDGGDCNSSVREIEPPVTINFIHQLQVENMLVRFQKEADPDLRVNGNEGVSTFGITTRRRVSSL